MSDQSTTQNPSPERLELSRMQGRHLASTFGRSGESMVYASQEHPLLVQARLSGFVEEIEYQETAVSLASLTAHRDGGSALETQEADWLQNSNAGRSALRDDLKHFTCELNTEIGVTLHPPDWTVATNPPLFPGDLLDTFTDELSFETAAPMTRPFWSSSGQDQLHDLVSLGHQFTREVEKLQQLLKDPLLLGAIRRRGEGAQEILKLISDYQQHLNPFVHANDSSVRAERHLLLLNHTVNMLALLYLNDAERQQTLNPQQPDERLMRLRRLISARPGRQQGRVLSPEAATMPPLRRPALFRQNPVPMPIPSSPGEKKTPPSATTTDVPPNRFSRLMQLISLQKQRINELNGELRNLREQGPPDPRNVTT